MVKELNCDLCVIGGGIAGLSAAISASRKGLNVVLVHDRPVLGGNASSEIRMWIRGASIRFPDYREGGIVEELAMDNMYYNPYRTFPLWDGVLYNKAISEKNLTLLLNATCNGANYEQDVITDVNVWQLTTYTNYKITATYFADCSGDSILSQFVPAQIRLGRESFSEFREIGAKEQADEKTMGMSCLIQCRETTQKIDYEPFPFTHVFEDKDFDYRMNVSDRLGFTQDNFWWLERGGKKDTITQAEEIKKDLIADSFGVWDYIKNSGKFDSENWDLEFAGFLGGKRENRRYVGDYILTQNDLEKNVAFKDEIAYGGWSMDDHDPNGIEENCPPNVHYNINGPYAIPLRCIYSSNIKNLFFAGRNISATHMALSSTRVMATCALLGQAVGVSAYVANKYGLQPNKLTSKIEEIQQNLRNDDCFLLRTPRKLSNVLALSKHNLTNTQFSNLTSGIERKIGENDYAIELEKNQEIVFEFEDSYCEKIRLVFDNDIARDLYEDFEFKHYPMKKIHYLNEQKFAMPASLVKEYKVWVKVDNSWKQIETNKNHQRLQYVSINEKVSGIKFAGVSTYGSEKIRLYSIDVL